MTRTVELSPLLAVSQVSQASPEVASLYMQPPFASTLGVRHGLRIYKCVDPTVELGY